MGGTKNVGHAQLNCLQMHNHMEFLKIATHYLFPIDILALQPSAYFNPRAHCSFPGQSGTLIKCEIVSQSLFCGNGDLTLRQKSGDIQTLSRLLRKFGSTAFQN